MTAPARDCSGCEAEGLRRVLVVRDMCDYVLWGEIDPLRGVQVAMTALRIAANALRAAGYEGDE